jgi:hypothetical protein
MYADEWGDAEAGILRRHEKEELRARRRLASREDSRIIAARKGKYMPPPREADCPPRPDGGRCQCCNARIRSKRGFHLDHCHRTGAFRGWVCNTCNTGVGMADDIELLEKRLIFLINHEKKMERLALIKAVHRKSV